MKEALPLALVAGLFMLVAVRAHMVAIPLWRKSTILGASGNVKPHVMRISRNALEQIERFIGRKPAEQGGMLGGSRDSYLVDHFVFDRSALRSGTRYSPNCTFLNNLLRNDWNPSQIFLLGFVHSHPAGLAEPSAGDLEYAKRILKGIPEMPYLLLPIVMTEPDNGQIEVIPFAAVRHGRESVRTIRLSLEVIDDETSYPEVPAIRDETKKRLELSRHPIRLDVADAELLPFSTFERVGGAYDLSQLASARVISIGAGGAVQYLEEMARAGVGEFVLIDPDKVTETNLATQQVYRKDIGRPKVDCLAERIQDINPQAFVLPLQMRLEEIDDREFERLALSALQSWKTVGRVMHGRPDIQVPVSVSVLPAATLLGGFTDSFDAQARVNRLALHLGIPSLCAQVYAEGRGAEISFTYPGVTSACHRCALSSRYKAYLSGFQNDVTSNGTPIFATTRLNALKGFVSMALLHHGTSNPRWGGLLQRIGNRNLIQIRMDPDLSIGTFAKALGGADSERVLFDEAIWLPQKPDSPENGFPTCPDCGGTGDLKNVKGTFSDTRTMRS